MSRVQLALNVNDIDEAVGFYTKLFGTGPAKRRPGYANFAVTEPPLKLVLLENPGQGGTLNHLGIEVPGTESVGAEQTRLARAGLVATDQRATTCCYATQDKFWVQGAPGGESWEIYTVLEDSSTFYGDDTAAAARQAGTEPPAPDRPSAAVAPRNPATRRRPPPRAAVRPPAPSPAPAGARFAAAAARQPVMVALTATHRAPTERPLS